MSQIDLNQPGADPFDDGELTLDELERIAGGWSSISEFQQNTPPLSFEETAKLNESLTSSSSSGLPPRPYPGRGAEVEKKCDPFRPMMTYCWLGMSLDMSGPSEECELWSCNAQGDKYVYLQQLRISSFSMDKSAEVKAQTDSAYSSYYGAGGTSFNHASGMVLNLTGSFP
jgi:hypothetical protein